MRVYIFLISIFLLGLLSCKSKKNLKANEVKEENRVSVNKSASKEELIISNVIKGKRSTTELWFTSEVDYNDGKQSISLNVELSAKRNDYIYLNAKALGIVNVARVLIKRDSIRILDLVNRQYISASYGFMKKFTNAPIEFEQLQNITWANAIFDPKLGTTTIDSLNEFINLILEMGGINQKASYNSKFETQSVALIEQTRSQEMRIKYNDFRNVLDISYPHEILINIQGEKKMDCKFTISNFATNLKKEPQFVVPKSYKVKVY